MYIGLTRQNLLNGQTDRHDRHESLVRHWVDHRPHHCLKTPFSGNPAID